MGFFGKKKQEEGQTHDDQVKSSTQPLISHLMALRKLLVACAIAILAGFVLSFYLLCNPLMDFITSPISSRGITLIYTAVSEAMTTKLKVSLISGIVLVSPFIFYQIWSFIKPALYENEIRTFRVLFFLGLFMFLLGVVFCYRYVYELALNFFIIAGEDLATPMLSIDKYVGFLFSFVLPFGVVFELPIAVYMGTRLGWVDYAKLSHCRKYVFFGIFVLAAILTPPDVVSQIMLGVPIYILYEVGVLVSRFTKNRREAVEA